MLLALLTPPTIASHLPAPAPSVGPLDTNYPSTEAVYGPCKLMAKTDASAPSSAPTRLLSTPGGLGSFPSQSNQEETYSLGLWDLLAWVLFVGATETSSFGMLASGLQSLIPWRPRAHAPKTLMRASFNQLQATRGVLRPMMLSYLAFQVPKAAAETHKRLHCRRHHRACQCLQSRLDRPTSAWSLHCCKLTWKWRGALRRLRSSM